MRFIPAVSPVQIQVPLPLQSNRALALSHIRPGGQAARHRPFTAVTRVRFPSGSPPFFEPSIWRHSSAGRASASHAEGHRFEFCCLHHAEGHTIWCGLFALSAFISAGDPLQRVSSQIRVLLSPPQCEEPHQKVWLFCCPDLLAGDPQFLSLPLIAHISNGRYGAHSPNTFM